MGPQLKEHPVSGLVDAFGFSHMKNLAHAIGFPMGKSPNFKIRAGKMMVTLLVMTTIFSKDISIMPDQSAGRSGGTHDFRFAEINVSGLRPRPVS